MVLGVGSEMGGGDGGGSGVAISGGRAAPFAGAALLAAFGTFGRARGTRGGAASAVAGCATGFALIFARESASTHAGGSFGGAATGARLAAAGAGGAAAGATWLAVFASGAGASPSHAAAGARRWRAQTTPSTAGGTPMIAPSPSVVTARRRIGCRTKPNHGRGAQSVSTDSTTGGGGSERAKPMGLVSVGRLRQSLGDGA